ncbi:MAG: tRNA uracil 4-sulfurtransferase ThiI [Candidatus Odinarchaeia archaeon]
MPNKKNYLIRYAEIGIKSRKTRARFEKILITNIKSALQGIQCAPLIRKEYGRIFVEVDAENNAVEDQLRKVFGVASFSPVIKAPTEKEKLIQSILEYAKNALTNVRTYAVRCRRVGEHEYKSKDIEIEAGAKINEYFNNKLKVNLTSPEKIIFVEVRGDTAYLYHEVVNGPGGLPLGSQGKFVSLISGGIDSPVAAYLMMKRGAVPILLYFDTSPYTDERTNKRVTKVVEIIKNYAPGRTILFLKAPYGKLLETFSKNIHNIRYLCVLCKRNMLRVAEAIAHKYNADAIVTGESIGQKASQTLRNSRVITSSVKSLPVHRPLIALDKLEIEQIAKKIGTFNASIEKAGCCSAVPRFPSINADLEKIEQIESEIDIPSLIEDILNNIELIELK